MRLGRGLRMVLWLLCWGRLGRDGRVAASRASMPDAAASEKPWVAEEATFSAFSATLSCPAASGCFGCRDALLYNVALFLGAGLGGRSLCRIFALRRACATLLCDVTLLLFLCLPYPRLME